MPAADAAYDEEFLYKFEIYFPLYDQNGQQIAPDKFRQVINEIYVQFGGLTMTSIRGNPIYEGYWRSKKTHARVHDKNSLVIVLTQQDDKSVVFFQTQRGRWEKELNYEKLLITYDDVRAIRISAGDDPPNQVIPSMFIVLA